MKRTLSILIVLLLCLSIFVGCDNASPQSNSSQSTNDSTTAPNIENKPNTNLESIEGLRVWDCHHPDDSERNPHWSIEFASMPNVVFERKNASVYANNELLIGGSGDECVSFYTAWLAEKDNKFLCFGMRFGSENGDERIVIIDFDTKQEIFTLHDSRNHDYQLFLRNEILCVREKDRLTNEYTRTGKICYTGTNIQVSWDDSIKLDQDRDRVQDGEPIS